MLYLDTSLLVSAFAREPQTPRIQQWLRDQDSDELTISDWVIAEFSSALSIIRTDHRDWFSLPHRRGDDDIQHDA